ncbi:hypothetical protein F4805DRAFT_446026 [Annulohypoxylon moriforme]|nr:hypothetical protein F4805DRAFT_446026 [Annulohypoxylon moriforme]
MSGNAVGFAFQADVTNTGSLLHTLTGRALKAMSDGGVDFYAVVAAISLGKNISIRDSLGNSVRSHIMSKGGIQSVLSKALSIGWGHKGLAVEMTNTKAGTNALLLVGAIVTGWSPFQAAQCFSELLSLRGCEPDALPHVDVLKNMMKYLAPFVYDLGFSKVLENVTTTAIRMMKIGTHDYIQGHIHLTIHGDAAGVAGGINQLLFTSQKGERFYVVTRMRGAWFAAFASHILGMSVELRLNDTILWASAGHNGTAIFELGEHQIGTLSIHAASNPPIQLVDISDQNSHCPIVVDYLVGEVFTSLTVREPRIPPIIWEWVERRIVLVVTDTSTYSFKRDSNSSLPWGYALKETLEAFGLNVNYTETSAEIGNGLDICDLDTSLQPTLIKACGKHRTHTRWRTHIEQVDWDCLCKYTNKVMVSLAFLITRFMRCRFDVNDLRIREDALNELCSPYRGPLGSFKVSVGLSLDHVMNDIMALVGDNQGYQSKKEAGFTDTAPNILGLSTGKYTVGYTYIMQDDCYDNQGRLISLWSGRASVNGATRRTITEMEKCLPIKATPGFPTSSVASGSFLEPHYCPSNMEIYVDVFLDEETILMRFAVGSERLLAQTFSSATCLNTLALSLNFRCSHDPKEKYKVESHQKVVIIGFYFPSNSYLNWSDDTNVTNVFALRGNKFEQIVMAGYLESVMAGYLGYIFQLEKCLKCCISDASAKLWLDYTVVIMGG